MDAFVGPEARDPEPRARRFELPGRGGAMAALDFGPEARPIDIVFSHANGFNARTYRTILAPLAAELRVLAIDLRGHGASTLPADPSAWTGWRGFADDLLALLDVAVEGAVERALEGPVVLAGHSLGATSSLLAAGAAPQRARALVLFEPVLFDKTDAAIDLTDLAITRNTLRRRDTFPDRAAAIAAYRGRGAFRGWSEAELADYVAAGFRETAEGEVTLACRPEWEALTYARHDYDAWSALAALRCPVRLYAGEQESSVGAQARTLGAVHGVRLEVIPRTTHFLPMERPDLVRQALREAVAL